MPDAPEPAFRGGRNIAMKVPPDAFETTLAFYRDTLGLPVEDSASGSFIVEFGAMRLWLDRVETVSQAELWLEVETDSAEAAAAHLAAAGAVRCDPIEPLPEGFPGFWIKNPAGIVHLVVRPDRGG